MQEQSQIKLVTIGDGSVGKTCMLLSYTTDKFPTDYVPTVFDNYTTQVTCDGQPVSLSLWDTAGQETYSHLRTLSYQQADIFLIVFSVIQKDSFQNVLDKWYPELSQGALAKVPKVVVGNKIDMRDSDNPDHIKMEAAKQLLSAQSLDYYECSAMTQDGLKEVFDKCVQKAYKVKLANVGQGNTQTKTEVQEKKKDEPCCHIW